MIPQVVYTHSNCSDVWEMFVGENRARTQMPLYIISDIPVLDGRHSLFLYSDDEPYYKVWAQALESLGAEYFIYLQEDFVLYDFVDEARIGEYVDFLKSQKGYSFVRLLRSGRLGGCRLADTLYEIESTNRHVFAMQATIWRTGDYINLMNRARSTGWLETDADYRDCIIAMGLRGAYHYDGEPRRGRLHYDSKVYPYIATALVRGQWALNEYASELAPLLRMYDIDIDQRGIA